MNISLENDIGLEEKIPDIRFFLKIFYRINSLEKHKNKIPFSSIYRIMIYRYVKFYTHKKISRIMNKSQSRIFQILWKEVRRIRYRTNHKWNKFTFNKISYAYQFEKIIHKMKPREWYIPANHDYTGIYEKFDDTWMDKEDYIHVREIIK